MKAWQFFALLSAVYVSPLLPRWVGLLLSAIAMAVSCCYMGAAT